MLAIALLLATMGLAIAMRRHLKPETRQMRRHNQRARAKRFNPAYRV